MKNTLLLCCALLMLQTISTRLHAQAVFSRFEFNHIPLTDASVGPHAVTVDADAISDGTAAYIIANCGALKGFDLKIPNGSGIFDVGSIGMDFSFRKTESRSDFFVRGGTSFYQTGGELFVTYRTTDGLAGFIDYGPFNTGFVLPTDASYHIYSFVYVKTTGLATVKVDGATIWFNNGPDNRSLHWVGAPTDVTIGTVMDGNCPGAGTLDYASFFNPDIPLSAEYLSFEARQEDGNVNLAWETTAEGNSLLFSIERSRNGMEFSPIAKLNALDNTSFRYTDIQPGDGQWFYRIQQTDLAGSSTLSKIESVKLDAREYQSLKAWPNPAKGLVTLSLPAHVSEAAISVIDLQGRTVMLCAAAEQGMVLDLGQLPRGLYSIQCQADGKRHNQKIMLE